MELEEKIKNKTAIVAVVGLGYVGLPLAVAFAEADFNVIGYETQADKVNALKLGISHIKDIEDARLKRVVYRQKLIVTNDPRRLEQADAICICVPTPLSKQKDPILTFITCATAEVSRYLRKGQLIILESTTYPGSTRELVMPILESSGLKAGRDFFLAFSPERVDPLNKKYTLKNTPKVIGGFDTASTNAACLLYSQVVEKVVPVSSLEAAEVTKLFENCFRLVNIAYVNEFSEFCEKLGVSIWEVIDAARTKPFGFMPFYPGPGVGGHCIPVNPYYLFGNAREHDFHIRFLELATAINEQMPYVTASKIIEAMSVAGTSIRGAKILVLGVSYKKDIGDLRESPALKLIDILTEKGARVTYNDPYVDQIEIHQKIMESEELTLEKISSMDCIVIATDHSDYEYREIVNAAKLVFDTRGVTRNISRSSECKSSNIVRLGEISANKEDFDQNIFSYSNLSKASNGEP